MLWGRTDYFYRRLQREIADQGIADVEIRDTVSDEELAMLYAGARAFLFPSLYEGFGLPPLEAMAYGVPVLSHDHPCMREILGDAALFADATDSTQFVYAMKKISEDGSLRQNLISKGKLQAAKYSWQETADATFAVYKTFI